MADITVHLDLRTAHVAVYSESVKVCDYTVREVLIQKGFHIADDYNAIESAAKELYCESLKGNKNA